MTLNFSIEYRTEWGQNVEAELCFLSAEGKTHLQRIPLETDDGLIWKGLCTLKARSKQFRYTYVITEHPSSSPSKGSMNGGLAQEGEVWRGSVVRREWDVVPRLFPADDARTYFFIDHWRDIPEASHCYTDAYKVASGQDKLPEASVALFPRTYLFRVQAPQFVKGERVALVGDQPTLGNWDVARALPMIQSNNGEWILSISGDGLRLPFQYKYIIVASPSSKGKDFNMYSRPFGEGDRERTVLWEEGPNRQSPSIDGQNTMFNVQSLPIKGGGGSVIALSDGEIRLETSHWKVAGLVVPLFSLRSEGSQGVGDFGDLKEMADWAASTGMHAVQLLPIYDTIQEGKETDSYPYNAISVHALHPIYADLRQLPLSDKKKLASFQKKWQQLNAMPVLDYVEVIKMKQEYLHLYYEETFSTLPLWGRAERQSGEEEALPKGESREEASRFSVFIEQNAEWLQPYCVFCHLRDTYHTPQFSKWKKLSSYNRSAVTKYIDAHAEEVGFYAFVQYLLHKQLSDAAEYAHHRQVFLKGDLPIGISPRSVEAWHEPHLFNMNMVAGAPPDDFSRTGQNWGFPTYDWDRMAADGYLWWRQRLGGMAQYFSAYRIDHILGFFRIWSIPKDSPNALLGQFSPALPLSIGEIESYGLPFHPELFVPDAKEPNLYHPRIGVIGEEAWLSLVKYEQDAFIRLYEDFFFRRHNDFWAAQAMKKLPALLDASNMLVCGEDLGMVPECVGPVMKQLGILSLEIQAMPKTYGVQFAQLHDNPYRSVDTIFTHDMPTLRLWWKENPERTQLYYNNVLEHDGKAPEEPSGWLCEEIIAHHLNSPSMLCLISLQDWLSIDEGLRNPNPEAERINVPANPKHYWRYRMHLPISELQKAKALNERLQTLITRSER
ncbi:MAG: 4-alpha-glucanotransferase [Bacteroidaceae bacterium]|nr:4-alpha-glucanotransferase [Bacteroidaceae bacterium]